MTRFYLRIVVVIFLTVLAMMVAFDRLGKEWEKRFYKPRTMQHLHELADSLREKLAGLSEPEARQLIEKMGEERDVAIALVQRGPFAPSLGSAPADANRFLIDLGEQSYLVRLTADPAMVKRYMKEEEQLRGRGLFQAFLLIGIAGIFIVRPLMKKLRVQEETIAKIADGDLSARVAVKSNDALGRLGRRLNLMADRIQELLGHQRQLIQAVSHEMRTPTARIGFALEMLEEAKTDEERRRRIASLNEDLADMDALLDELLTFLRFEETTTQLEREPVDLVAMARGIGDRVRRFRPELVVTVSAENDASTWEVAVSRKYFPRVLENLLMNAMRHAASRIDVSIRLADAKSAEIQVSDDGPGIAPTDAERIFEPFTRLDPSRNHKTGGSGLGLAIAKRIVEQHRGTIAARSAESGGAAFIVSLPAS